MVHLPYKSLWTSSKIKTKILERVRYKHAIWIIVGTIVRDAGKCIDFKHGSDHFKNPMTSETNLHAINCIII